MILLQPTAFCRMSVGPHYQFLTKLPYITEHELEDQKMALNTLLEPTI